MYQVVVIEWRRLWFHTRCLLYVATNGVDSPYPGYGVELRSFKTIRYACEEIEKGHRNAMRHLC